MTYLLIGAGLLLLVAGGETLVRGAVDLARHWRMSPLLIGLTLVGFGTSTPELLTSLQAAFAGSPGIALGNVVGSNTANILLILGLTALIGPVMMQRRAMSRDATALIVATVLTLVGIWLGLFTRPFGALMFAGLIIYLVWAYRTEKHDPETDTPEPAHLSLAVAASLATIGLLLTIFGARLLVDGAIELAANLGISETLVGVTIVAVGTSLPELVTSIMAAIRKHGDVAFGNIVGSNIFNLLGILGLTALIEPLAVPSDLTGLNIWAMVGATALMLVIWLTGRLQRWQGGVMLALYAGYVALTAS